MSLNVNPNIYTGKINPEIMMPLVLGTNTFDTDAVTLHTGVNGRLVIGKQDVNVVVQDYADTFDSSSSTALNQNLSDVVLQPVPMTVNMDIPKSSLFTSYMADMLPAGIGANNTTYGDWVAQALASQLQPKIAAANEQIVWLGTMLDASNFTVTSPPTGAISLIAAQAKASRKRRNVATGTYAATNISASGRLTVASTAGLAVGDVLTITNSTGTPTIGGETIVGQSLVITSFPSATTIDTALWTTGDVPTVAGGGALTIGFVTVNATSVFDAFQTVLKTLPDNVKMSAKGRNTRLVWAVSGNVADAYNTRLLFNGNGQVNYLNYDPTKGNVSDTYGSKTMSIFGYQALVIPGLAPNTIVFYPADSIHVGSDLALDSARLFVLDLTNSTADNVYRVRCDWQVDTKIIFPEQFSIISPLVS